jgi:hypothetical protein
VRKNCVRGLPPMVQHRQFHPPLSCVFNGDRGCSYLRTASLGMHRQRLMRKNIGQATDAQR